MRHPVPEPGFCFDLRQAGARAGFADLIILNDELTQRMKAVAPESLPDLATFIIAHLREGFAVHPQVQLLHIPWPPLIGDPLATHMEAMRFKDGGKRLVVLRPATTPKPPSHPGLDLSKSAAARGMAEEVIVGFDLVAAIEAQAGGNLIETFTKLMDELVRLRLTVGEAETLKLPLQLSGRPGGEPAIVACEFRRLTNSKGGVTLLGRLAA